MLTLPPEGADLFLSTSPEPTHKLDHQRPPWNVRYQQARSGSKRCSRELPLPDDSLRESAPTRRRARSAFGQCADPACRPSELHNRQDGLLCSSKSPRGQLPPPVLERQPC